MTLLHSLILGLVEGITEFLPISSTAHLIIVQKLLGIAQSDFAKTFAIAIQSGAILAVVVLYWRRLWHWRMIRNLVIAFIPTGVLGFIFYDIGRDILGNISVILWALGLGGLILIIFEWLVGDKGKNADIENIGVGKLIGIGLFQSVSMIPGVSRAAATIIGGRLLGISRVAIVEFSFLLAVPTMAAATGWDLLQNYQQFSMAQFSTLGVGFVVSFIAAIASIRWLLNYIRSHSLANFGIYRIILVGAIVLFSLL